MGLGYHYLLDFIWKRIILITRIWGFFTSVFLFGVGVDLCFFHQLAGGFTITASLITFILETCWATNTLLQICTRNENHWIFSIWDGIAWIDTWKKTIIYSVLAVVLFAQPHRIWLSTLSGFSLIILGVMHIGVMYYVLENHDVCLLEQQDSDYHDEVGLNPTIIEEDIDLCIPQQTDCHIALVVDKEEVSGTIQQHHHEST